MVDVTALEAPNASSKVLVQIPIVYESPQTTVWQQKARNTTTQAYPLSFC